MEKLLEYIFTCNSENQFRENAFHVFDYQYKNNTIYRQFCDYIRFKRNKLNEITDIPFLPIELFKNYQIKTGDFKPEAVFHSSGTTGSENSKHYVASAKIYEKSFLTAFNKFFGNPKDYVILALLPSYLEKGNSSLVFMVNRLIELSESLQSGFYLYNLKDLNDKIQYCESNAKKYLLFGVSYALLDFAEQFSYEMKFGKIIETGGMKGKRKEIIREELHSILKNTFKLDNIFSEYGMTEMLSQAYSLGNGVFSCPPQMKVLIRDTGDPLNVQKTGKGALNIIDLANIYSCSFIASSDIGKVYENASFTVDGRFDDSDVRGCNLLV